MMYHCEVCEIRDDLRSCGFDDQPMLAFCTPHWIQHVETAHKDNVSAQQQARALRSLLPTSQQPQVLRAGAENGLYD
jgi:hypothetical protein